jgi:Tfp pilus assembly protein PilF
VCKRSLSGRFRGEGGYSRGMRKTDLTAHLDSLAPDADRRRTKNRECHEAIRINPTFSLAQSHLGSALGRQGKIDEAVVHFRAALRENPDNLLANYNLGIALMIQGKREEAAVPFREALRGRPGYSQAAGTSAVRAGKMSLPVRSTGRRDALRSPGTL